MSGFEKGSLQELKARISIVDLVRRYVNLRNAGGRWVGPCPFHQETKPSFSVNEQEGFYYCFGCQAHGDAIDFYCKINGLDFRDGVEQLAQEVGLTLRLGSGKDSGRSREERDFTRLCLEMYARAQEHFRRNLNAPHGETCRSYLQGRGMNSDLAKAFGLGFSLPGWDALLKFLRSTGFVPEQAAKAGLLSQNEKGRVYDRFRGRLMFPIQNLTGQVIAFGGRVLSSDDEPKYINSSDTAIYKKGEHLYGLFQARRAITHGKIALLTEGYVDVLTLHQFGYTNACGVLGTALTPQQIKRLSGFCSRVDLLFDGDNAGRKAALRSSQMLLTRGLSCRVVLFPEGEDADSLLRGSGPEAFDELLRNAEDGLDYCLRSVRETYSPKELLEWVKNFSGELEDPALLSVYLPKMAQGLGLNESELRQTLLSTRKTAPNAAPNGGTYAGGQPGQRSGRLQRGARNVRGLPRAVPQGPGGPREKRERQVMHFAIRCPQHLERLETAGAPRLLVSGWAKNIWSTLWQAQGEDVLSLLGEEEKKFYIQSRLEREALQETEEAELEQICWFLGQERRKDEQAVIRRGTPRAGQDEMDILRALQETLGRNDG